MDFKRNLATVMFPSFTNTQLAATDKSTSLVDLFSTETGSLIIIGMQANICRRKSERMIEFRRPRLANFRKNRSAFLSARRNLRQNAYGGLIIAGGIGIGKVNQIKFRFTANFETK